MTLPPRKHKNSGRQREGKDWPQHRQFVRGFACAVANSECWGSIQCCHVDFAGGKGVALKVDDRFSVPLCHGHHREQTDVLGWPKFEQKYGLDALKVAAEIARVSPSLIRAARALGHDAGSEEME